jgi:hypothetical protein
MASTLKTLWRVKQDSIGAMRPASCCSSETSVDFQKIKDVTFRKRKHFIATAVKNLIQNTVHF